MKIKRLLSWLEKITCAFLIASCRYLAVFFIRQQSMTIKAHVIFSSLLKACFCCLGLALSMTARAEAPISRDPTAPAIVSRAAVKEEGVGTAYQLQSILIDGGRRIALINDKFVSKGDLVNNAEVLSIDKNSVVLMEAGQKITLYLFEGIQE